MIFNSYVYVYLNPLKPGNYNYGRFNFKFQPFYIGKSGCLNRIDFHINESKKSNNIQGNLHKIRTINKIFNEGFEPIRFKIYQSITEVSSNRLERYLIKIIGRSDLGLGPLTNLTNGGEGISGYTHTKENIEKIRQSSIKKWEDGILYSELFIGENNGFYGKTHTEKNKEIFSKTCKKNFIDNKQSKSHIQKKSNAIRGENNGMFGTNMLEIWIDKYGRIKADEMYKKFIEDNRKGNKNPMYGKKGLDHPSSKKYKLIDENENETIFESIIVLKEYLNQIGIKFNTIRQYSSKDKKFKGYRILSF